jgi:hypothetical protein
LNYKQNINNFEKMYNMKIQRNGKKIKEGSVKNGKFLE